MGCAPACSSAQGNTSIVQQQHQGPQPSPRTASLNRSARLPPQRTAAVRPISGGRTAIRSRERRAMRAQQGAALWAALACALLACAAAKAHKYKKGQEVPIWANKGKQAGGARELAAM